MRKYYYVGIMSYDRNDDNLSFVYEEDNIHNICYWKKQSEMDREKGEKPKKYSTRKSAQETATGLCWNNTLAMVIETNIDFQ